MLGINRYMYIYKHTRVCIYIYIHVFTYADPTLSLSIYIHTLIFCVKPYMRAQGIGKSYMASCDVLPESSRIGSGSKTNAWGLGIRKGTHHQIGQGFHYGYMIHALCKLEAI